MILVHVFADYPVDMRTRCGLGILDPSFAVTRELAAFEAWGGALEDMAICARCAGGCIDATAARLDAASSLERSRR